MNGNRRLRGILAALGAVIIGGATVTPVFAAAPDNDDIATPTVIAAIPYSDGPYDTTEATPGTGDPTFCYGGDLGDRATVWYSFTAADSRLLQADTFGSDYDTTLYVGTANGSGGIDVIACNDDAFDLQSAVAWNAEAGTTYLFAVGTCCGGAGLPGGGGQLVFHLDVAPPAPSISLTTAVTGTFTSRGSAIVRGTATCDGMFGAELDVSLSQRVGRQVIRGGSSTSIACTGSPEPWSIEVFGFNGKFAGGQATVVAQAFGCGLFDCASAQVDGTVRLRK